MRSALLFLIFTVLVAVAADTTNRSPREIPNRPSTVWEGSNSQYAVRMVINPTMRGVTNYAGGRVALRGTKGWGHIARFWKGGNGWVTADWGYDGSSAGSMVQFQIIGRSSSVLTCRTDNADMVLSNKPPETFLLRRVR